MPKKQVKNRNVKRGGKKEPEVGVKTLTDAYALMCTAREMSRLFEDQKEITNKYVHATCRGHEAVQLAASMQLLPQDYLFPYYRDDAMLLGIGFSPYELMLQLMAKRDDPFSGGRTYYSHPSVRRDDMPKIPHQSAATGMQAIPSTGAAQGIKYLESQKLIKNSKQVPSVVLCSLGDASITEGEVSEAFQMAVLHKLPVIYLVQDNEWDISASAEEFRAMDAAEYALGFKGLETRSVNGSDFAECYDTIGKVIKMVRKERRPFLIHAKVPLLSHHTSGVRMEWYRSEEDLKEHESRDPVPNLRKKLIKNGIRDTAIKQIEKKAKRIVKDDFASAGKADEPVVESLFENVFAPTPVTEEKGERSPGDRKEIIMVDAALHAIDEIMKKHPESVLYGQDVGGSLGGVFRETAFLAERYGKNRVFNTPIQEAYIIGSTAGMSAAGCKPIVEVQFADYIWPGLNQLCTELSKSCYLSNGKWPVQSLIRVPIGAYGSGGPYHSSSVESVLLQIKGVKVVYPSNAADIKGLMKAAFYDPNPVVMLEHKGLYWSKVPGTGAAKTIEPDEEYVIPLGKSRIALETSDRDVAEGNTLTVITYGMGVHWALNAAKNYPGKIEIVDLRTLNPLDEAGIYESVRKHSKCLVLTEEPVRNSFAQSVAGRIAEECFDYLDAPVKTIGAADLPAVPLNTNLEQAMLPTTGKVSEAMGELLRY